MTAPALFLAAQGQGVVTADNINTLVQGCDTFAQLRGLVGLPGICVFARGQLSVNDGLGGFFYWNAGSSATDDNLNVITPTGAGPTGRYLRLSTSSGVPQVINGTYTSRNGSITTGGTSQQLAAANTSRKRLFIQNPASAAGQGIGAAESIFINYTSNAGINDGSSIELLPSQSIDTGAGAVTTDQINVIAATTGHRYIAKEM